MKPKGITNIYSNRLQSRSNKTNSICCSTALQSQPKDTISFGGENFNHVTKILLDDTIKLLNRFANSLHFGDGLTAQHGRIKFAKGTNFTGTNYKLSELRQENGSSIEYFYYFNTDKNATSDLQAGHEINGHGQIYIEPTTPQMSEKYNFDIQKKLLLILSNFL